MSKPKSLENLYPIDPQRPIFEEIQLLKRKIKLVEGERKANYELNEEVLKRNEVLTEELRQKLSNAKKEYEELRKSKQDYTKVIAEAFGDDKKAFTFRGKTFEEAKEILQSMLGDSKNKLNLIKYKNLNLKKKMEILSREEKQLEKAFFKGNKHVAPMLKELRQAENDAALMQMRITEAENVQAKYKIMLETLKGENYTMTNRIRDLEEVNISQKKEATQLKDTLSVAVKARKAARTKLTEIEEQTMKECEAREEKLLEARQELRQIREKMEEVGSKLSYPKYIMAHRDSSLAEGIHILGTTSVIEQSKPENTLEGVYQKLVEMTGETDANAIVERFHQQRNHAQELERSEANIKSQVRKEKLRKRFLQDKLIQLQFSGGIKREMLDKDIESLNTSIRDTEEKKSEVEKRINEMNEVMDEMMKKLQDICNKNEISDDGVDTKLPLEDRIRSTLKSLFDKAEEVLREQENVFICQSPLLSPEGEGDMPLISYGSSAELNLIDTGSGVSSVLQIEFDRNKLSPLPPPASTSAASRAGSARVSREREIDVGSERAKSERRSDSSEEEAASRNSIKRQSQGLVETKTRKGRLNKPPSTPVVSRRQSPYTS